MDPRSISNSNVNRTAPQNTGRDVDYVDVAVRTAVNIVGGLANRLNDTITYYTDPAYENVRNIDAQITTLEQQSAANQRQLSSDSTASNAMKFLTAFAAYDTYQHYDDRDANETMFNLAVGVGALLLSGVIDNWSAQTTEKENVVQSQIKDKKLERQQAVHQAQQQIRQQRRQ